MTKRDCRDYRRIDDIDSQWLADYAHKNPGVYIFGTVENIEQLKQGLGSIEWQRILSAWRKHKQRQAKDSQLLSAALKDFHDACQDLNLIPHEVLQVLTAHLEANGGEMIAREIEAMRQVYSRIYGPHSGGQSFDLASAVEKSNGEIKE
jgi:hypothetical protein